MPPAEDGGELRAESAARVRRVFELALEHDPEGRGAALDAECGTDTGLRADVERLLAAHARAGGFLEAPPRWPDEPAGTRLGAYEIVAPLGRGGMGIVLLARRADDAYRQEVAIKVVHAALDTPEVRRRFRQEREILARLEHAHIARLLDGGTTADGRPYVVMERVLGLPIDRACDERRLGLAARLELMRQVCLAVHYAHRHLVVHRDLKPSNILVTDDGQPKLLDFGIAKLLDQDGDPGIAPTRTRFQALTPEYASPEQLRGEPVTTASDVYALGVMLYELLAGRRPHAQAQRADDLLTARTAHATTRPSVVVAAGEPGSALAGLEGGRARLARRLAGDLDTIVLQALRPEAERRYGSAEQLAEDLQRYRDGLPVLARRESLTYRAAKFVRRNRLAVAAAAAAVLVLAATTFYALREARQARAARHEAEQQRQRAERRFADVRKLANSFLFELHDAIADLPGALPARKLAVARAREYLDSLAAEAGADEALREELAHSYERLAVAQGQLGDSAGMQQSLEQAYHVRGELLERHPDDTRLQLSVARTVLRLGDGSLAAGDLLTALVRFRKAADLEEALLARPDAPAETRMHLVDVYGRLCNALAPAGDMAGAVGLCLKQRGVIESLLRATPGERGLIEAAAWNAHMVGNALRVSGKLAAANVELRAALEGFSELQRLEPDSAAVRRGLATTRMRLGAVQADLGQTAAAARTFEEAVQALRALSHSDPQSAALRTDLAYTRMRRVATLRALGRARDARRSAEDGLALLREQALRPSASASDVNDYAWWLATCEEPELRQPALALELAERAASASSLPNPAILHTLAWAQFRSHRRAQALATLDRALALIPAAAPGAAGGLRAQIERDRHRLATERDQE